MDNQKKLELIADILEADASELKPEDQLEDMDNWDSMAALAVIVMFEDNCGKKITAADIKGFKTVEDIMNLM